MELVYILIIVFIGLGLIVLEIIVIPGSTIVGIIGFSATVGGTYLAYRFHGYVAGNSVLAGSIIVSCLSLYLALKFKVWSRFSVNNEITGKSTSNIVEGIKIGDEGISTSSLRPYGKGEFNDKTVEIVSLGQMIETNTPIKIIKIEHQKIFVESIK